MEDKEKTRDQLVGELALMRQRVAELEESAPRRDRVGVSAGEGDYFRTLVENAADALLVLGAEGRILYASPSCQRVLGFENGEGVGENILERVHPDDVAELAHASGEHMANPDGAFCKEVRVFRKDGSWRFVEVVGTSLPGDSVIGGVVVNMRDITDRKRADEALRREGEYFRSLIENSSDAVAILDGDGRIRYESPSAKGLLGYEEDELCGSNMLEFLHPDDLESARGVFGYVAGNSGAVASTEVRFRHKDGSWCILEGVASNLLDNPQVNGVVVNYWDITARKRTEEALRESERRYRFLAENLSDVIWIMDTNLNYTYVSSSVSRLRGYAPEEAMAQTLEENMTPASLEAGMRLLVEEQAEEGSGQADPNRSVSLEAEVSRKDGSTVWTENRISYLRDEDGRVTGYLGVSRDITERKWVEEALRESEAKYSELVEKATDGVAILQDGVYRFANRAMADIVGYSVEEMEGMSILSPIVPELREAAARSYGSLVAGKAVPFGQETKVRCKDGTTKGVEASTAVIQYRGKPALMAIVRDISARKRTQQSRMSNVAALAKAEELQRSRQRIVKVQEALRRDIAQQIHGSVQNRVIILLHHLTEIQRKAPSGGLAEEVADVRQKLGELLDDYIRPISHRLYPSIVRQGLVPALQSLGDHFESALAVEVKVDEELARRERANRGLIPEQVRLAACRIAEEALTNVVKHAKASKAILTLDLSSEGQLGLAVQDDGQGFDVGSASGGLGILMIQDYAEVAGGQCVVLSAPGKGSTVEASFPQAVSDAEPSVRALP